MQDSPISEGTLEFRIPSHLAQPDIPCSTYYRIVGDLQSGATPLIIIHGGPGSAHNYLLTFAQLWPRYGVPVIFYDQLGCGRSTRLKHMVGNQQFWTVELQIAELDNLLDSLHLRDGPGFHLLGHSYGGFLAPHYATSRPQGLRRLLIYNGTAAGRLTIQGFMHAVDNFAEKDREAIFEAQRSRDFEAPAFKAAMNTMYRQQWSHADPWPGEELQTALDHNAEDNTARVSLMGPSLFAPSPYFMSLDCIPLLHRIDVPTLVLNGEADTPRPECTMPFFDHIPRVRFITFANASHMMHCDSPELKDKVLKLVGDFVKQEGK